MDNDEPRKLCGFGVCAYGRQCVSGSGPLTADIFIVGEAPGREELRRGAPFLGRSGNLLDELLGSADLARRELRVTNTCGCVEMSRDDKRPLPDELDACRPRLLAELEIVGHPKVAVLMGNTALSVAFPGFRIGEVYNEMRAMPAGWIAIATYHPSAVLRGSHHLKPIILEALKMAKRIRDER